MEFKIFLHLYFKRKFNKYPHETSMADGHNKDMYNLCEFHTWRHRCSKKQF